MLVLPTPLFAGLFPKITRPAPEWLARSGVQSICSVSNCISPGPEGWINHWQHNSFGFYNSEELALSVITDNARAFDFYAYEIYPLRWLGEQSEQIFLHACAGQLPPDYELLGLDIVTRSASDFFECSPLSCNNAAMDFPVNPDCLIDDEGSARSIIEAISLDGNYEPGPYFLFRVYRKNRT